MSMLCLFVFQAVCKHFESVAIDVGEVVDLVRGESGSGGFPAWIGEKLLACDRVNVDSGQKTLETGFAHAATSFPTRCARPQATASRARSSWTSNISIEGKFPSRSKITVSACGARAATSASSS